MPNIRAVQTFKVDAVPRDDSLTALLVPDLPMLAKPCCDPNTIAAAINEYLYEEKYDGERMLVAAFNSLEKKCFTRTLKLSNIFKAGLTLSEGFGNCIFDGELIYLDSHGRIVPICDTGNRNNLRIQYMVFDVQMINGANVAHVPLVERQTLLRKCLIESESVRISKATKCSDLATTLAAFDLVCANGGEGLMLKHSSSVYSPNRRLWVKLKSLHLKQNRDEFELYAYKLRNDKNGIPNILDCGYFERKTGQYVHVSNVSSGIDNEKRNKLRLLSDSNTGLFRSPLIVTIVADKITAGKSLRHPSLYRIRTDLDSVDTSKFDI